PIGSWHLIDFVTPTRGYIGSNGACIFTPDGGDNWVLKSGYPNAPVMFGMDFRDEQVGLAGGLGVGQNPDGIFKTTDGGTTWLQKSSHIANDVLWWTDQVAFAATDGGVYIYRSTDAGETWNLFSTGITTGLSKITRIDNTSLAGVSPGGDVWRSTNEGLSWTQVLNGPGDLPAEWSLRFVDNLHGWLVGQSGFIFTSDDGGLTWRQVNNGVGVQLYDIEMQTNDFGMAIGHNGYVFRTTNGGSWWDLQKLEVTGQIFGRDESLHGISIVDSGFAVVAGPGGTVFRTTNGGTSWQSIGYPNLPDGFWIEDVKFVTRNDGWLVGLDQDFGHAASVYRTTNGGTTWVQAMNQNSYMWAVDFVDAQHGWIATIGELYFRTTNGGATWVSGTLPSSGSPSVSDMQFANQQVGWAVGWSGFVVRTTNGGASWTVQNIGTTEDHLFSVHVVSPSEAWLTGREADPLTMNGVVYHTTNGGTTWTREVVAPNPYWGYAITGSGGNIWIAGYEGRIMKKDAPTAAQEDGKRIIPQALRLYQNYPNPFNPSTSIQFDVPTSALTTLKVFDILGREVAALVNEVKQPGTYNLSWNAGSHSSGLYFFRLESGGFTETKRMLLLK
ncbi:MAG: YCF48-related protein, partial [Bacteroidota bacterium]